MFSGIVSDIGRIAEANDRDGGLRLTIASDSMDFSDVRAGDSIAVNGVCLTVVAHGGNSFTADVSRETLKCTAGLDAKGGEVNLEKAMRLSDRLGGHLVSGHVDGVGEVLAFDDRGESWKLDVRAPKGLAKFIAIKGSVTVNGVSLTVNQVKGRTFSVNLIPHTLQSTNLKNLNVGTRVNIEVDLVARYVERILAGDADEGPPG